MEKNIHDILKERFSKDSLISLATIDQSHIPWVRTIDAIYFDGSFYTITYAKSKKMFHIDSQPYTAICGEWFSGHALCENLGHVKKEENQWIAEKLRKAFSAWYDNGHTNEDDVNTIILKMKVLDGIVFSNGQRYEFHEDHH